MRLKITLHRRAGENCFTLGLNRSGQANGQLVENFNSRRCEECLNANDPTIPDERQWQLIAAYRFRPEWPVSMRAPQRFADNDRIAPDTRAADACIAAICGAVVQRYPAFTGAQDVWASEPIAG